MKKIKLLLLLTTVCVLLNSCVYSLFPIYTEDTLVFREELLGKWYINEETNDYMTFVRKGEKKKNKENKEYKYEIEIKEGFTMSSNDPIFIIRNGEKIYEEDRIREAML